MSRWIDIDDDRNCYIGNDGEYERWNIDPDVLDEAKPTVESDAQSIGKCETCYYWGNRIMVRDGSLGDCGNFGVSLSKDFFCAWWSQKETVERGEEDG